MAVAKKLKVPLVTVGINSLPNVAHAYSDSAAVGRLAAKHFLERGFTHCAYCSFDGSLISQRREAEFVRAVESSGHHCHCLKPDQVRRGKRNRPLHDQLVDWLKKLPKPIGIFCAGDVRALDINMACRDAEVSVPAQVAILGVGNDELLCRLCSPQLSSIDCGYRTIGFEAARLLKRLLDGHPVPPPVGIPPVRVVVRESSDVVAVGDPHVAAAVRFIRHHIHDGVNVKDLMKHIPVCRRKLELAFRTHLGRTLHQEITLAKLHRASWLLVESHRPLSQVAKACGMGHPSRLTHLFQKYTGMPPLKYRKMHQLSDSRAASPSPISSIAPKA
jgi:LacI family transcriptional regulator